MWEVFIAILIAPYQLKNRLFDWQQPDRRREVSEYPPVYVSIYRSEE